MFRNMKIGLRLGIGFGLILLIFTLVSFFIINRLDFMSNLTDMIYKHPLTVSNAVLKIEANTVRMHRSMKDVALARDDIGIDEAYQLVDQYEKEIYRDFEMITERFLGDKEMYENAIEAFGGWKPIRDEVIALMRQGRRNEAADITKGKGARYVEELDKAMLALHNFALNKAESFHHETLSTRTATLWLVYILFCVAVLAGVIFIVFFTRSITQPLSELVDVAGDISQGNLDREIPVKSGDEIGHLATAFRRMAGELKEFYADLEDRVQIRTEELSKANEKLGESEERFRSVVETANDAIVAADSRGNIIFWNRAAETIFGYLADEVIGKPVTLIMPEQFHENHRKRLAHVVSTGKSSMAGKVTEVNGLRKDGGELPVELSLAIWNVKEKVFFTAIIRDVAERKAEDARKMEEQELEKQRVLSMRSDRLRSLGEMAAGIAHELNQPLVGVRGIAEHILIGMDRGWELTEEKLRDRASTIVEQADRMTRIIEHVRMFARESGKPELRPVQINEVVKSAVDMLDTQLKSRGIELEYDLAETLPIVSANPFSLEEVIINLLINARDALEEQAKTESAPAPRQILMHTLLDQSDSEEYVRIEVSDNGIGIPEEIIERVFDPFFTTKSPDRGTGLGLSISKSIVEDFKGAIEIQSRPGVGTTVTISLSARDRRSQKEQ